MNIEKIENYLDKLPDFLQLVLMVLAFPVFCLIGVLSLAGLMILIEFILRG